MIDDAEMSINLTLKVTTESSDPYFELRARYNFVDMMIEDLIPRLKFLS